MNNNSEIEKLEQMISKELYFDNKQSQINKIDKLLHNIDKYITHKNKKINKHNK